MKSGYEAVIGLEVHAQLKTESKAFCSCPTVYGAQPNVNVCPICLGHPGTLPVLNENLVAFAVRMGLATNCSIREHSTFSRKNYFYPDLPKGYQISQYSDPICYNGWVEIETDAGEKNIGITRIHMEEDAGKSIHDLDIDTLVDLNRSGIPLIEIVSEPDIRTAHEAYQYLLGIRQTLVFLGICDGNLEEGSLRCDANVSVRKKGDTHLNTKSEVKNLNSFRNVEKAIGYEIDRQIALMEDGNEVQHQTMMWDAGSGKTKVMRSKEEAHDYRYFAEPDLLGVTVDSVMIEKQTGLIPELGLQKKRRFMLEYGLPAYDAAILTDDVQLALYYEEACQALSERSEEACKMVSNWILTELMREMSEKKVNIRETGIGAAQLASLVDVVANGSISHKVAKEILPDMFGSDVTAQQIIKERGLEQVSDESTIKELVAQVLLVNAESVEKLKQGKTNLFGFLVGQALKASGGSANPSVVCSIMKEALEMEVGE
ncbi:MAG: Asp-tRNA(Asn)/Glu-tRNA(Gln) amidotransferase subunit GatB [Ignavibacteria bacterium]|nr:Asp-tRNA(Asn)/Glu-tRNA(Gln) amidotransferase subunit GatB [Ignavibacteria bacterium]